MRLLALSGEGVRRELKIDKLWPHKHYLVLKFLGVDSIDDAAELVGQELQVPASQRAPVEPGATYISDLIGCVVWDRERRIGAIEDVRFGAGEAPLLVVGSGKSELEIPFAQEFLNRLDLGEKRIDMRLPAGLLEVNAPLTEEEKKMLNCHKQ